MGDKKLIGYVLSVIASFFFYLSGKRGSYVTVYLIKFKDLYQEWY